ncbi:hypothetical protein [Actinomycetospora sp. TBRC 11914]|uniref:hypothetical protein n=1 Tax=Actinomycetospora sp. TBRC 11914 TaxID=2729387 RepID=UPI00145C6869|nr:hypothetical protein [Actinomycetospora sp. TBRC 11914]NMO90348.1 hypothetical protein [Actinomycetospora sp. TBRC 11914]
MALLAGGALAVWWYDQARASAVALGTADWTWAAQEGPLRLGVTHGQYSVDTWQPAPARTRADAILREASGLQNQYLMGFGVLNPEPAPGVFDWSRLDQRMGLVRETGGTTVLTLAGAPDWMKGGAPGVTDFSRIEVAPDRAHYADFARLAAAAVQRYPQIQYVQVWSELKGFYSAAANDWDAASYTDLYNAVYDAVKQARPTVRLGGPYVAIDSWAGPAAGGSPSSLSGPWGYVDQRSLDVVDYWLGHARGADFVVVDGGTATKDGGLVATPATAAAKFAVIDEWLRGRTTLPIWWAEFYPEARAGDSSSHQRAAATLEAVAALATSGASATLLWQPEAQPGFDYAALWTSTASSDGGRPTALTTAWTWLAPRLAHGEVKIGRSGDGKVLAFQSNDSTLLLNTGDHPVVAGVGLGSVPLAAYGTDIVTACGAVWLGGPCSSPEGRSS